VFYLFQNAASRKNSAALDRIALAELKKTQDLTMKPLYKASKDAAVQLRKASNTLEGATKREQALKEKLEAARKEREAAETGVQRANIASIKTAKDVSDMEAAHTKVY
jgi:hypothetical protein